MRVNHIMSPRQRPRRPPTAIESALIAALGRVWLSERDHPLKRKFLARQPAPPAARTRLRPGPTRKDRP
jgi:hypothetical protein